MKRKIRSGSSYILLLFIIGVLYGGGSKTQNVTLEDSLPCPNGYEKLAPVEIPGWIFDTNRYTKKKPGYHYFTGQSELVYKADIARSEARESLFLNALSGIYGISGEESMKEISTSRQNSSEIYDPEVENERKVTYISTTSGKRLTFDTEFDYFSTRCFNQQTGQSLYQCFVIAGINPDNKMRWAQPDKWFEEHKKEFREIKDRLREILEQQEKTKNVLEKLKVRERVIIKDNRLYARDQHSLDFITKITQLENFYRSITFRIVTGGQWPSGNERVLVKASSNAQPVEFPIDTHNNCINSNSNLTIECKYDHVNGIVLITEPIYKEILSGYLGLQKLEEWRYRFCVIDQN